MVFPERLLGEEQIFVLSGSKERRFSPPKKTKGWKLKMRVFEKPSPFFRGPFSQVGIGSFRRA